MHSHVNKLAYCTALCFILVLAGCSDDDEGTNPTTSYDYSLILDDYADKVVIATYQDMSAKAAALVEKVDAYAQSPANQDLLNAAAQAWVDMREPWEASEAFLFGPAEYLSLDPALDSWPVDRQQLNNVLASEFELTPEFIAEGLGPALRGFHTVEYLLFRDGQPRHTTDVTAREIEYLQAVTVVLQNDADALHEGWTAKGFGAEFANAGKSGSRYLTQSDAVIEIVEGIIAIADEVANGKIADPYVEQDVQLVESQFSYNSLSDFADNMLSIKNAYLGGYHKITAGTGLTVFIAERNSALDTRIRAQIEEAIAAIQAIPAPFRNNLTASTEIEAAQASINEIVTIFENEVKPLIAN